MKGPVCRAAFIAALLLLSGAFSLTAQESPAPAESSPEVPALSPEQKRVEMEINTSTLPELAAWCRSLGLSEGGTRVDLIQRLRAHFSLPLSAETAEAGQKLIVIEAARMSEYFRLEVVDEEYARLTGDVRVSLKDGNATHRIRAWEILFNRTRNTLTASGGVEYVREQEGAIETFRGESITANLDNWSSVFLDGITERAVQGSDTSYRFEGTVISRSDQEVTVLSKAAISNAKNEEAYWSLNASRVWLLPGSDFAIFNAVLKVGEIPVLYIPFFYYPADEVIFHPVIGYRTREGSFLQTTTYLMGRPKTNTASQSSLSRILGNSGENETAREGLFLRNTGKKVKDPNTATLKAIVDYYVNLGAYLGAELNTVQYGILRPINLTMGIGFTRTIIGPPEIKMYTPFYPKYDGSSDWNSSNLFSTEVPFRYRFKMDSSIGGKYGNLSWSFPFYSDPWIDKDFTDRAETMDWVNIVQQGAALQDEDTTTSGQLPDYDWKISGDLTPSISALNPYISALSIRNTITMGFKQIASDVSSLPTWDPKRFPPNTYFFVPDRLTIYSISGSISGTPLTLAAGGVNRGTAVAPPEIEDPLKRIGVPRAPWESPETSAPVQRPGSAGTLSPPALAQRFELPRTGGPQFSIAYNLAPTSSTEMQLRSFPENWSSPDEVDWSEVSSLLSTFGGAASTTFNLNHSTGLYANAFTLAGNGTWEQYGFLNEESELYTTTPSSGIPDPAKIEAARKDRLRNSSFNTTFGYTGTIRPLYQNAIWGGSNLQYTLGGLIAKSQFVETSTANNPEWKIINSEWNKEKISSHQLSANLAASIMNQTQNLTLTARLPPRDIEYLGNATFRIWITETRASMSVKQPGEPGQKIEPFDFRETITFGKNQSLQQYLLLDTEKKELTTLTTTLTLWGLRAEYAASRMRGYDYSSSTGWSVSTEPERLQPQNFTLSYSGSFARSELWNRRLKFYVNLNSRLFFDLQRYTNSSFSQTLGFTLGINGFVDLSLSATSANEVIVRYFKDTPLFNDVPLQFPEGDQNNFFIDLFDSFRFDDERLRRRSGFKMRSFTFRANHHLGDWNALLDITMSPYLDMNTSPPQYLFNSQIAFLVQWVPVSEIKSDIKYEQRTDKWVVK